MDNFIKRMAKVLDLTKSIIEGPHTPCAERPPIPYLFHFQATGVAITEVRGAGGGEDNNEGGGVRRLALNRWPSDKCWFVLSKKNKKKTKTKTIQYKDKIRDF